MFVGCQPVATPAIIIIPSPTEILFPTAMSTPIVVPTLTPTATPKPLCGTPAPASTSTLQLNISETLTRFEPPDGQSYFGFTYRLWEADASEGDVRPFAERICDSVKVELGGKTPTIIKVYAEWNSPLGQLQPFSVALTDINKIQTVLGQTVIPMLEWQSGNSDRIWSEITTKEIASGKYDEYIRNYAQDVKAYGKPLFIRLVCGEFNGSWWHWCSPKANSDLTAKDFVGAWQKVVKIFLEENVSNVAWVWTPAIGPPPGVADWRGSNWQAYYPGDEYVDWVGIDIYEDSKMSWLDPFYQFGIDHNKPFFMAEFGIRTAYDNHLTATQHMNWLNKMFDYFENHPNVKTILYFNHNVSSYDAVDPSKFDFLYDGKVNYLPDANDGDMRLIAGGPEIRSLFARRIINPRYVSTLVIEP
jgi:hypothetical protein